MKIPIRQVTPRMARLLEVIEVISNRGSGTEEDPYRKVVQYWSKAGELLAESDPEKD